MLLIKSSAISLSKIPKKFHRFSSTKFQTIQAQIGKTPLVKLQRLNIPINLPSHLAHLRPILLAKLEGNNPAGSVKDRPAISMIEQAELKGLIKPGDTLIEATSGNTGIALAMAAAIKGYKLILIMPENMSEERRAAMAAYGATFVSVPPGAMELARDVARDMASQGKGRVLDQFSNLDNPLAHFTGTGPEVWNDTDGKVTHFISSMGTTGTIMGTSKFLKSKNPKIEIIGLQPGEGSTIPGIRRWSPEYLPKIFDKSRVDQVLNISQREAEETMRAMARIEGIFAGTSSGGSISAMLRVAYDWTKDLISGKVEAKEAPIMVAIVCDRGDRYLSTGMFDQKAREKDPQPCTLEEWPSAVSKLVGFPHPYVLFGADEELARKIELEIKKRGGTLQRVMNDGREVMGLTGEPTLIRWKPLPGPEKVYDADSRIVLKSLNQLGPFLDGTW